MLSHSSFIIMHSVRKNLRKLVKLKNARPCERKRLLENADDDLILTLCECSYNTLNNNVPLTKCQYKKLRRHKNILRRLVKRAGDSIKKKRNFIKKQTGGWLLPLLVPILGTVISNLIAK